MRRDEPAARIADASRRRPDLDQAPSSSSQRAMGSALWNGGSTRRGFQRGGDARCAGSSSGASTRRGRRHRSATRHRRGRPESRARAGELERLGASRPSGPFGRDGHAHHAGLGRGGRVVRPGRDPDADGPPRPEELGVERGLGRARYSAGPALGLPAELTGQPGRQPDGDARRAGSARARRPRCGPSRSGPGPRPWQGGSKNCATSSRHRVRPNQAVSRLNGQTAGSSPSRSAPASAPGSGRSRISREHSSARSRKRASCGRGSPVHQRTIGQLGLEQRPDGPGEQVDGIRARRGARSARSRPAAGPAPADGTAPRPRPRSDARDRPTRAPRSPGRGTAR